MIPAVILITFLLVKAWTWTGSPSTYCTDVTYYIPDSRPPEAGDRVLGCIRPARRCGSARLGSARCGSVPLSSARLGSAQLSAAWCGSARLGSKLLQHKVSQICGPKLWLSRRRQQSTHSPGFQNFNFVHVYSTVFEKSMIAKIWGYRPCGHPKSFK